MKVLFDQGTPKPLAKGMRHHSVTTSFKAGLGALQNGDLLTAAEKSGYDVLVTTDKNMRYQQNLSTRKIAIVVLGNGQWPNIRPHAAHVTAAVDASGPGSYTEVAIPYSVKRRGRTP